MEMDCKSWPGTSAAYRGFSEEERFRFLVYLMDQCSASERWRWQQELTERLHRDLVSWLPLELALKILSYLDAKSLLNACQVNRTWCLRVNSSLSLWKRQAYLVGSQLKHDHPISEWKDNVRIACITRKKIKDGKAFGFQRISQASITAMDYDSGQVGFYATASVNDAVDNQIEIGHVSLYQWPNRRPLKTFRHSRGCVRVSALKLLYDTCVCAGYVDGSITCWEIESGTQTDLNGHSGAIYSLAADMSLDILVSGSADRTAIIWNLSRGNIISRIRTQMHWIVSVVLQPNVEDGTHALVTMSKEFLHVFKWKSEEELTDLKEPIEIALKEKDGLYQELRDVFFTPGLHVNGREATFVRQMPLFETQTIGDADVVTVDLFTGQLKRSVHINQKVRKLLAVGKRFALVLLPFVDLKYKNLAVVDLIEKKIIGGCAVPHSRASTPDFAQIMTGDKKWLDGISRQNTRDKLVAALAAQDSSVYFVRWY